MKHVTHRLEAWLGGELTPDEAAAVEAHVADCVACRGDADDLRDVWEALAAAAPAPAPASVWPDVQARTTGRTNGGWFFGGTPALRAGLATAAVAAGLVAGVLLPGGGTAVADEAADAGFWLSGTSWAAEEDTSLDSLWLTVGGDEEAES